MFVNKVKIKIKITPGWGWRSSLKLCRCGSLIGLEWLRCHVVFWPYHIDDFSNFEDTWLDNQDEFQKTGPTKFIYCSILSKSEGISKIGSQTVEEIDFENGRFRNFGVTLTLTFTFNRVKGHTVVHPSSTSTHIPNIKKIGRKNGDGRTSRLVLLGHL